MEILYVYLIIGVLFSTAFFLVTDFRHKYFLSALCIAWLPLILIGIVISSFMNLEEISNKYNRLEHKTKKSIQKR